MPYIEVNGASLFYKTYGDDRPGCLPIVLVHGSTNTGDYDWRFIAPLLARDYRVIVPDCRGHGKSTNPNHSYSFKELAADVAGLVRGLGYRRAHIVGHSNGGNVALVTLLEHPDVVQTAILQAANAYVSPDLVEKEPPLFDPERVARESPQWMHEMIAFHTATHGEDYWRELLHMTVQEIISEPNYTPEDLSRVSQPVLVIQGENDRVNAQAYHGEFIAHHIPSAELWIPKGVGHSVHFERTSDWVASVLDFLSRRGDTMNDALYRLGQAHYADKREYVYRVYAPGYTAEPGETSQVRLTGEVLLAEQHQAVLAVAEQAGRVPVVDEVEVLLTSETPYALVNRGVTDLRAAPSNHVERLSQGLLGEAVRILNIQDNWCFVQQMHDGYLGWMHAAALYRCMAEDVPAYHDRCDSVVQQSLAEVYAAPDGAVVGQVPFGVRLPVVERRDAYCSVLWPDGRVLWMSGDALWPLADRPQPDSEGIQVVLDWVRSFVGIPYLWGGRSPFGYDCSGLAQIFWHMLGVAIPRDADQQMVFGSSVEGAPQPGDLLFFGQAANPETFTRQRVTHVAISLGGDAFIHANGATWSVALNSLDPQAENCSESLRKSLLGIRSIQRGT
ncbi:MAG: alpha/beta fold hydrolase [Anaerolineae bacterium]|nr:alpha/beta fold hydrolase [Anaerolineae bacterium]